MPGHDLLVRIRNRIDWAFPERQIFLRAEGAVSFLNFSRRFQMCIAAASAVVVCWCLFATIAFFTSDARLSTLATDYSRLKAERDVALQRGQDAGRDMLLASVASHGSLALVEAQRRENLARLDMLASASRELRERVAALSAELEGSRAMKERLAVAREEMLFEGLALRSKLAAVTQAKAALEQKVADLAENLNGTRADKDKALAARNDLLRERGELQTRLAELGTQNTALEQRTAILNEQLADAQGAREKMESTRAELESHAAALQRTLETEQNAQKALVESLASRVTVSTNAAERAIAMTGLDAGRLLFQLDQTHVAQPVAAKPSLMGGMGGPFVAFRPDMMTQSSQPSQAPQPSQPSAIIQTAFQGELGRMVEALDRQADRRDGLERVLARLPLAAPLDDYQVMSPFGPRLDPINGKLGYHTGIDLASAIDAPVLATAAGMVVFAGRNGGYGNMVEIDHGMGVHTRYAHLRKILVRVGQKVPLRAQIGIMGTTGRSTGMHVHYEIVVDDQPYDPAKFLRAGLNVFSKD